MREVFVKAGVITPAPNPCGFPYGIDALQTCWVTLCRTVNGWQLPGRVCGGATDHNDCATPVLK